MRRFLSCVVLIIAVSCTGETRVTVTGEPGNTEAGTDIPPVSASGGAMERSDGGDASLSAITMPEDLFIDDDSEGEVLPGREGALFSGSGACAFCHTNYRDDEGRTASYDALWRTTMLANAARDPYWRATVRAEVLRNPGYAEVIEEKCARCHTPMAAVESSSMGRTPALLDEGFLDPGHPMNILAEDGVSCSLCHQIEPEGLGTETSFDGGFVVDTETARGTRVVYGPNDISETAASFMRSVSGFMPVRGGQIEGSGLCGSCHTLRTPFIDGEGEIAGIFHEQEAYEEWRASDLAGNTNCQACHQPPIDVTWHDPLTGRDETRRIHRHIFVGGNAYMLNLLGEYRDELGTTAPADLLNLQIGRTIENLRSRTASLEIRRAGIEDGILIVEVEVRNLTGHRLPTGFPSRRAWLRLLVRDEEGRVIFESGSFRRDGSIIGNANDEDPSRYEEHRETISEPEEVEIYEAILGTTEGEVTTGLLTASSYLKDNRLLPAGFTRDEEVEGVSFEGTEEDPDFTGGSDLVRYRVPVDRGERYVIEAELLYQTIGYRWAMNLAPYRGADEVERFVGIYEETPNIPVRLAAARAEAGEED